MQLSKVVSTIRESSGVYQLDLFITFFVVFELQIYDFAHIGNFRAFLTYDILKRWLTWLGAFVTEGESARARKKKERQANLERP